MSCKGPQADHSSTKYIHYLCPYNNVCLPHFHIHNVIIQAMDTNGSVEAQDASSPPPYVDFVIGGDQVAFANHGAPRDSLSEGPGGAEAEGGLELSLHRRLSLDSESDTSSVDERLSVSSIASSVEDQLT